MKIIASGVKKGAAVKLKQQPVKSIMKTVALNSTNRLFFATDGEDVAAGSTMGRELDGTRMNKKYFVPIDEVEPDQSGVYRDVSGLADYARMARVIHDAEYRAAIKSAEEREVSEAKAVGRNVDRVAMAVEAKKIQVAYYGDFSVPGQAVYPKIKPLIGPMSTVTGVECLVVPMKGDKGDDLKPVYEEAMAGNLKLNGKKTAAITTLINSKMYFNKENGYLEVGYVYEGVDATTASRNATFQGISTDTAISAIDPESWKVIKNRIDSVPRDPETILARNKAIASGVRPLDVINEFKEYVSQHVGILVHLQLTDESEASIAQDMVNAGIITAENAPKIKDQIEKACEQVVDKARDSAEDVISEDVIRVKEVTSIRELVDTGIDVDSVSGDLDSIE